MMRFAKSRMAGSLPKWEAAVCLVLAALCLFNPFLNAASGTSGLHFCHAASHRATVGSSELQQFTPTNGRSVLESAEFVTVTLLLEVVSAAGHPLATAMSEAALPAEILPASLWFRPPPIR
jgi:hypothetical protein